MRRFLFFLLLTAFALAACSAPSPEQLAATAQQMVATGVALTLEALPSNTSLPTADPTPTLTPETLAPTFSASSPTISSPAAQGTLANVLPTELSATEKADKSDNSTVVLLQNNSGQEIWLIIDSPIYLEYRFSDSFTILLPVGVYDYRVWIGKKGPFEGTFRIGNHDKHTMIFSAGKVQFQGP
jgi:hypothetical protein